MDNKLNNMLNDFLKNNDINGEDINEKLKEFTEKYNKGEIKYENTPLDDAYEILEKAKKSKTKNQAIKLAKKAYELCNECLEAILFQVHLEGNSIKRDKLLNDGLDYEKRRLEEEGYFKEENIGHFYGIFETRPYIRGLSTKASLLFFDGKATKSKELCLEILKLNTNDNLGIRYLLMAIYAYLEEEKNMLKLYKKCPEDSLSMLFPQLALYYKIGNDEKAKTVLDRIVKINPHFIDFFNGKIKEPKNVPAGYYSIGDSSEVLMYFEEYFYLLLTIPRINEYILDLANK